MEGERKGHQASLSWSSASSPNLLPQAPRRVQTNKSLKASEVGYDEALSDDERSTTVYAGDSSIYGQMTASQVSFWTTTTNAGPVSDLEQVQPREISTEGDTTRDRLLTPYELQESHDFPDRASEEIYRKSLIHDFHPSCTHIHILTFTQQIDYNTDNLYSNFATLVTVQSESR